MFKVSLGKTALFYLECGVRAHFKKLMRLFNLECYCQCTPFIQNVTVSARFKKKEDLVNISKSILKHRNKQVPEQLKAAIYQCLNPE